MKSKTRTSLNTWLRREQSELYDTLYRRAADVLNLDEKILTSHNNAEDIQVSNNNDSTVTCLIY